MKWMNTADKLATILRNLVVTDCKGRFIDVDEGFKQLMEMTESVKSNRSTIYFAGNGASASMASHAAADLFKNAHVITSVFTDLAMLTAFANDISYDQAYAAPLKMRMQRSDMLVAISSSGASRNIINASVEARKIGGSIVTLTAMRQNNKLSMSGDINFYLPGETYGFAESGHAAVLHHWIDIMIDKSCRAERQDHSSQPLLQTIP